MDVWYNRFLAEKSQFSIQKIHVEQNIYKFLISRGGGNTHIFDFQVRGVGEWGHGMTSISSLDPRGVWHVIHY